MTPSHTRTPGGTPPTPGVAAAVVPPGLHRVTVSYMDLVQWSNGWVAEFKTVAAKPIPTWHSGPVYPDFRRQVHFPDLSPLSRMDLEDMHQVALSHVAAQSGANVKPRVRTGYVMRGVTEPRWVALHASIFVTTKQTLVDAYIRNRPRGYPSAVEQRLWSVVSPGQGPMSEATLLRLWLDTVASH